MCVVGVSSFFPKLSMLNSLPHELHNPNVELCHEWPWEGEAQYDATIRYGSKGSGIHRLRELSKSIPNYLSTSLITVNHQSTIINHPPSLTINSHGRYRWLHRCRSCHSLGEKPHLRISPSQARHWRSLWSNTRSWWTPVDSIINECFMSCQSMDNELFTFR